MKAVTVILAQGVVLRGPLLLGLTPEQAAPRAHAPLPQKRKGQYLLDGGKETAFKTGETFLIDDSRKLSPIQFHWEKDDEEQQQVTSAPADAGTDADVRAEGANGDAES